MINLAIIFSRTFTFGVAFLDAAWSSRITSSFLPLYLPYNILLSFLSSSEPQYDFLYLNIYLSLLILNLKRRPSYEKENRKQKFQARWHRGRHRLRDQSSKINNMKEAIEKWIQSRCMWNFHGRKLNSWRNHVQSAAPSIINANKFDFPWLEAARS
jgi:hypothetical protein